ncbi:MAG: PAS domain-containing protein [Planctomycetes bacterium]|nr:PAS domain-containing protein [Planctomycetota bacterium]
MARPKHHPTGIGRKFDESEIIVSKTDERGVITYANDVFLRVAKYAEHELLGQQHNCIRHPDMPRCVFQYLWDELHAGREVFAYVVNLASDGAHYWVFAHVTPSYDREGKLVGYHSSRRVPDRRAIRFIEPIYRRLKEIEDRSSSVKQGMKESMAELVRILGDAGVSYDELVFSLVDQVEVENV